MSLVPDGQFDPSARLAQQVAVSRVGARRVRLLRLAAHRIDPRRLSGERKKGPTMTVTCRCGTEIDAATRIPVGEVAAHARTCDHLEGFGPGESKMHRPGREAK